MFLHKGINHSYLSQVCKLSKSINGLKQPNRQWFEKLSKVLLSTNTFTSLLIYVYDLIIVGNNMDIINKTKATLWDNFQIKDLGTLKYFLGLEIARSISRINS